MTHRQGVGEGRGRGGRRGEVNGLTDENFLKWDIERPDIEEMNSDFSVHLSSSINKVRVCWKFILTELIDVYAHED